MTAGRRSETGGHRDPELDRFAHHMASVLGMPHHDEEFAGVVQSLGGHLASVDVVNELPVEPSRRPAPEYDPRP